MTNHYKDKDSISIKKEKINIESSLGINIIKKEQNLNNKNEINELDLTNIYEAENNNFESVNTISNSINNFEIAEKSSGKKVIKGMFDNTYEEISNNNNDDINLGLNYKNLVEKMNMLKRKINKKE